MYYKKDCNATKLAEILTTFLGVKISAKDVNSMLEDLGFQYKDVRGNWVADESAQEYCEEYEYLDEHSRHRGTCIYWSAKIVNDHLLGAFIRKIKEEIENGERKDCN